MQLKTKDGDLIMNPISIINHNCVTMFCNLSNHVTAKLRQLFKTRYLKFEYIYK